MARRPHIQELYKDRTSFEYIIIPIDAAHPTPPHIIVSELPPHIALLTTAAKIFKSWALLIGQECHELRLALIERSKMASHDGRPLYDLHNLTQIEDVFSRWTYMHRVPETFLSGEDLHPAPAEGDESAKTRVEPESPFRSKQADWEVGSSVSCRDPEPKRRLLPFELEQDFSLTDGDDDDASDDNATDSDDEDVHGEAAYASVRDIEGWVADVVCADADQTLVNNLQIEPDPSEKTRLPWSLDLDKPDYRLRHSPRITA
ncbi:hypothetical protein C8F04DRAFT_1087286 [Mycena alexandri]|uniref:Uncharacterized protein n=1 Tax=Mycena alexandri TaxID=1745969 RepID=A0AAD6T4J0_9AGAR|nr:hypothetical protein C8F04DRAFT_1087286 [Mycena alexandri]